MLYGRNGITGHLPPGARFLGWGVVPPAAPDDLLDLQIRLRVGEYNDVCEYDRHVC